MESSANRRTEYSLSVMLMLIFSLPGAEGINHKGVENDVVVVAWLQASSFSSWEDTSWLPNFSRKSYS